MSADQTGRNASREPHSAKRFSPALLVAGVAALIVAVWGVVGGPNLISASTLVAIVAIGAVAVAGVLLIKPRRGADSAPPTAPGSSADGR